ncbi:TetR/AcrR family transcriptional regulator C-terminal ligand-binding domain-containing protein [Streptomyces coelicoflavus]|uniref:TetR/AcrR family transcriptional regulator n=1 Tax=Streptomyces coelicoflavus TaxID=285562 RepID=UPI003680C962
MAERVLAAVTQVLIEAGYTELNFRDISQMANVSRTTLYRRWPTRADLAIDAITVAATDQMAPPDTGNFAADLSALLGKIADFITSPLGVAALSASLEIGASEPMARELFWKKRFGDLAPMFERAQARGELPAQLDIEAALAMLAGAIYFRVLVSASSVDEEWIQRIVTTFLAGA